ncbi:MAG: hypothetical protein Q7R58_01175, partial [bacterium]|nr:hypothetical protein [bacterium]
TVEGKSLYRYDLTMKKESIIQFYKDVLADATIGKKIRLTQDHGLLLYLQSKEFDDVFTYFNDNTFVTLWTDSDGFPAIFQYRLRIVPPDTATQLKDKQIDIIFKTTFFDINKPVNISVPSDAKPIKTVIDEVNKNKSSH